MKKYFGLLLVLFVSLFVFITQTNAGTIKRRYDIGNCTPDSSNSNIVTCYLKAYISNGEVIESGEKIAFPFIMKDITITNIDNSTYNWEKYSESEAVTSSSTGFQRKVITFMATSRYEAGTNVENEITIAAITYEKNDEGIGCFLGLSFATCEAWNGHEGLYFDSNGNVVDHDAYEESCNVPDPESYVCKKVTSGNETIYYNYDGEKVSEEEFKKSCGCKIIDNTYYDANGDEVSEEAYNLSCKQVEVKKCYKDSTTGKFYGKDGTEVDEDTFNEECNPKCEIKDDKYYDANGKEVSQSEYIKSCKPYKCVKVDDKYYNQNGEEVTEEEYNNSCDGIEVKKCYVDKENGKYYGKNGIEVTEDDYNKECIESPQTGLNISIAFLVIVGVTSIFIYDYTKRQDKLFN